MLQSFEGKTAPFRVSFRGAANALAQGLSNEYKPVEISAKKVVIEPK